MSDNNSLVPGFDDEWDKTLKITLSREDSTPGVLHVFLKGRIDNYNTTFFQNQIDKILSQGHKKILFRCASLDYVSSSGLGIFSTYFPRFKAAGGTFVFVDLQTKVLEIFQLLGFNHFFNIATDLKEAQVYFNTDNSNPFMLFPKSFKCPMCQVRLKANRPGKFRCSNCKTILSIDESAMVSL